MNTGDICEELKQRAASAGLELSVDSSRGVWYAVLATREDSYSNFLVRTFYADTLEGLVKRVRFPERTPSGRAVYV